MKNLVVLTGAGVSAESGISTFRDSNGLWEGHDILEVASLQGFYNNPKLVLDFYNKRRQQLKNVKPNKAHYNLVELEKYYNVSIITQNVDDLHERAGSENIIHLHGELLKVRSITDENEIYNWNKDLFLGDLSPNGNQLRPHIVWFGEDVPNFDMAVEIILKADIIIVIGTSMQVYPAASLLNYTKKNVKIYFIDPKPNVNKSDYKDLIIISKVATIGTDILIEKLKKL